MNPHFAISKEYRTLSTDRTGWDNIRYSTLQEARDRLLEIAEMKTGTPGLLQVRGCNYYIIQKDLQKALADPERRYCVYKIWDMNTRTTRTAGISLPHQNVQIMDMQTLHKIADKSLFTDSLFLLSST